MNSELNIINQTKYNIKEYKLMFKDIFNETIKILELKNDIQLSLIIVNKNTQLFLNKKYRKKDYLADVLTFYLEEKNKFNSFTLTNTRELGDVFICYEKAKQQSKIYNHSLKRELAFLFLHGFLHSLGYDHIKINEEKEMNFLQNKILENLKIFRNE